MNYHNITHDDMKNGDGLRVVLWVAGCNHKCKGCQNPITWDPYDGKHFGVKELYEIIDEYKEDYISGLTLSGGDPLYPGNREEITLLCKILKTFFPEKTIWCYTGYLYEQVKDLDVINYIDVLVDGPFIEELKDATYEWAGSTNQRVIRLKDGKPAENTNPLMTEYGQKEDFYYERCCED